MRRLLVLAALLFALPVHAAVILNGGAWIVDEAEAAEFRVAATPTACSDGADNDGDGLTDLRDDPGCGLGAELALLLPLLMELYARVFLPVPLVAAGRREGHASRRIGASVGKWGYSAPLNRVILPPGTAAGRYDGPVTLSGAS